MGNKVVVRNRKRRAIDKDFFKRWSSDMAYVLGFMFADGNLVRNSRGGNYFSVYSMDRKILERIQKTMKSKHKLSKRNEKSGQVYRFQVGSKEMCEDLYQLGFLDNKTKRMTMPNVPKSVQVDFVRGYFDGDGNVWSGFINTKRSKPTSVIYAAFTSGSLGFLSGLLYVLRSQGIRGGSLRKVKGKNCYRLSLSTIDTLNLYKMMYNDPRQLYLERKKVVFEKFIKMRS